MYKMVGFADTTDHSRNLPEMISLNKQKFFIFLIY